MAYRRIPSLNWLRVFEAAARAESFSAAAHILNMSPSAVSQQVSALEHYLGEQLFERHARRVKLSEAGQLFLPTVHDSLAAIETSAAELFGLERTEQLSVEANTVFAMSWLAPRLSGFQEAHPDVVFSIKCVDHFDARNPGRADIVISFGPGAWDEGETTELFSETVFPVATPSVAKRIREPADILRHRLIDVTGHRQTWRLVLGRLDLDADDVGQTTYVTNTPLAFSMAASGDGIALARAPASDWLADQLGLVPCLDDLQVRGDGAYVLATRPAKRRRAIATAFRDWLIAESTAHEH